MKRVPQSLRSVVQSLEPRLLFAAADLDVTFSGDGKALVNFFGARDGATAVAVQADGKVLLAGWAELPVASPGAFAWRALALARLKSDGTPDPAFGPGGADGDGRVTLQTLDDKGTGRTLRTNGFVPADLLALPGGKVLVLASASPEGQNNETALLRLNADGSLDHTFGGGDGVVTTRFGGSIDEFSAQTAVALAAVPDGKIVVLGSLVGRRSTGIGVARFLADGTPDAQFPGGSYDFQPPGPGAEPYSGPSDVAVAPDGDIVVVGEFDGGQGNADFGVLRIAPDGTVKARTASVVVPSAPSGAYEAARAEAVTLLPGGDVVVGGFARRRDAGGSVFNDFALARLNPNLTPDAAFGGGDGVVIDRFANGDSAIKDLAVLSGDKVLAAGYTANVFALARYNADGSADKAFDASDASPDGRKTTGFSGNAAANAVAIAPDGKFVAAGVAGLDMAVARYEGDPVTPPPPGDVTVYQAEDGELSGAVVSRSWPGYTGKGFVDYVTSAGSFVELNVFAPADGRYRVDVRYANGGSRSRNLDVTLDHEQRSVMTFAPTGSWSAWRTASGPTIDIRAGWRFLRFQTVGQNGPNIDSVMLTRIGDRPRLEAEQAKVTGAVVRRDNFGFSGTGYVDFQHDVGDSIEFSVDLPNGGILESLDVRYANGSASSRPLGVSIDGTLYLSDFPFAPTGGWATWATTTAGFGRLPLGPGRHTIKLESVGRNGPNIDWVGLRFA